MKNTHTQNKNKTEQPKYKVLNYFLILFFFLLHLIEIRDTVSVLMNSTHRTWRGLGEAEEKKVVILPEVELCFVPVSSVICSTALQATLTFPPVWVEES